MDSYFLAYDDNPRQQVSKSEFVRAERNAGLRNLSGHDDEPATYGFTDDRNDEHVEGTIEPSIDRKESKVNGLTGAERPSTALDVGCINIGTKLVSYKTGAAKIELEVLDIIEQPERGEYIILIRYRDLNTDLVNVTEAMALGLTPDDDGVWRRYAIPYDE